jgi:hypothetical protein
LHHPPLVIVETPAYIEETPVRSDGVLFSNFQWRYPMKSLSIVIAATLLASCSGMGMSGSSGSSGSHGMDDDSNVPYSLRPYSDNNPYGG